MVTAQNLLLDTPEDEEAVDRAMRQAVREALLEHKRQGREIAVWRDGKAVLLQPEEIEVPPLDEDAVPAPADLTEGD